MKLQTLVSSGLEGSELVSEIRKYETDIEVILDTARTIKMLRVVEMLRQDNFSDPIDLLERIAYHHKLSTDDMVRVFEEMSTDNSQFSSKIARVIESGTLRSIYHFMQKTLVTGSPRRGCFSIRR